MRIASRIIDVRPGEGAVAFKAFAALFGLIAGHTILETARDALFLETLPADRLTLVYMALAAIGLVVPIYNSRFVRAFGRRNAGIFTLMVAAFGTTIWHFQPMGPAMAYGLYVWSGLLGTVLVLQFWIFAGQLFTVSQGKRLFAGITSGGVLGAVAGGVAAAAYLALGPPNADGQPNVRGLLLVSAACFLGTALMLTTIPSADVGPTVRPQPRARQGGGLGILRDHPYVARVAVFVGLATATLLMTDFLFKTVVKSSIAAPELGSFFARYYAALNALALIVQVLITQRLLQRLGVVGALALLPLLLLMGSTGVLLTGSVLVLVLLTKGADGAFRHSLHRVGTELVFMPLPLEVRDHAKSLLDAVFVRGSQALTAGGILLLTVIGYGSVRWLAAGIAALALAWIASTLEMRNRYLDQLRLDLGRGSVDPQLLRLEDLDLDSVESVMAALSSTDAARVVAAMNLLEEAGRARLIPALVLYHDAEEVLMRALEIVPRIDEQEWKPHAVRLSRHESVRVRSAAVWALGSAGEADLIRPALDDNDAAVRAHAAFQLARCAGTTDPLNHPAIAKLVDRAIHASEEERQEVSLGLLDALRRGADERWSDVLLTIGRSVSPRVVRSVAEAMARVPDERFVPLLLEALPIRDARAAVGDALVRHGEPALEALAAALREPTTARVVRRRIPSIIGSFSSQRAADLLTEQLSDERDGTVRYRVLRALVRLVAGKPTVAIDRGVVDREMEKALTEHLRLLALWLPLDDPKAVRHARASALLLRGLLEDKMRQALERAFLLFKLRHPKEDVRGLTAALRSGDKHARASALEFLDALALDSGDGCRQLLRIVADDLSAAERVARAAEHIGAPRDYHAAMEELLVDSDDSVAALAAYHVAALGDSKLLDNASALLDARPALFDAAMAANSSPELTHA